MDEDQDAIRRSVQAFRDSDAHFRWLFEKAPVAISISRDGRTIHVNRKYLELYGFESVEELVGQSILDQWGHESQQMVREYAGRRARGEPAPTEYEGTGRRRNSSEFPVHIVIESVGLPDGPAFVAFLSDITERKQVEAALRESEQRYHTLFETAGDAIFVMQDDRFINCNVQALEMFGAGERAQVVGRSPVELSPPLQADGRESRQVAVEKIRAACAGRPQFFEWTHARLDGTLFPAEVGLNALDVGGQVLLNAIVRDTSERKAAQEALQRQSRLSELLMKMSATYINVPLEAVDAAIDRSLGELAESVAADRVLVRDYDFQRGVVTIAHEWLREGIAPVAEISRDLPFADFSDWNVAAHRRGEPIWIPNPAIVPEGRLRKYLELGDVKSLLSVPIMHGGTCLGFVSFNWTRDGHTCSGDEQRLLAAFAGMLVNIRQRKAAGQEMLTYQSQLQALAGQLASAEDRQRRELATVLHDGIGQILFSAAAKLVALRDGDPANCSRDALDSVVGMLGTAMRDTRELTHELCPPVLYEIGLRPALERLGQQFEERNRIACSVIFEADAPAVRPALRGMIYQAARELLANVLKHSRAQSVRLTVRGKDEELSLSVEDDGVGFEPATAGRPGAVRAGFGLFNIRERLRALGGRLEVASSPGRGCCIMLAVPLNASASA